MSSIRIVKKMQGLYIIYDDKGDTGYRFKFHEILGLMLYNQHGKRIILPHRWYKIDSNWNVRGIPTKLDFIRDFREATKVVEEPTRA